MPRWIYFVVAFWVLAFGVFRLYLATTRNRRGVDGRPDHMKRGLFARSARTHALYGVVYLLLGGYLVAIGLGYGPSIRGGCRGHQPSGSLDQP